MNPIFNFHDADNRIIGCGTQAELDHWTAEGVMAGVRTGRQIGAEPASEDERRKAAWAREAA